MTELEDIGAGREHLRLLRKSSNRIRAALAAIIEPRGVTTQQFLALVWIRDLPGLSQAELSAEMDSDVNTVSALIKRLEAKGLLVRQRHNADGRAVSLSVTEEGRQLVDAARPYVDRLGQDLLALMPKGHEAAIIEWLKATLSV
jgi:DNA-binding MarR family transcriptional regulator